MTTEGIIILIALLAVLFAFGIIVNRLVKALKMGKSEDRFNNFGQRVKSILVFVVGQARVLSQPAGIGHFLIFWGFIFISLGTAEHILNMLIPSFSYEAFFGTGVAVTISFCQDILAFLVLGAIAVSLFRRFFLKPVRLESDDPKAGREAVFILGLIFILILLMYGIKGMSIIQGKVDGSTAPVSNIAANLLRNNVTRVNLVESVLAWAHHSLVFFFLLYIPFSKHIHILGAIPNIFFRNLGLTGTLTSMDFEDETVDKFGSSVLTDFSWKQLLDLYACTECGRCQAVCPAYLTDKPLSPYRMIHNLRGHFMDEMGNLLSGDDKESAEKPIVPEVISKDELWACTTCGACIQECPTFIEHVQKIIDLRRYLVLTEASFPPEVQPVFKNMEINYNPWSFGYADRANWTENLDIPLASDKKNFDILFWIGCAGSFDDRGKVIAKSVVKLLEKAGVDFAILGTEEKCCGETARRMGNEYLAQTLIELNIEVLKGYEFNRILTICPHGLNSFRVDYPQAGYSKPVVHHSEFLLELVKAGKLPSGSTGNLKGVYHDACYLGRYNGIISEPRELISGIDGIDLTEFDRHGKRSFCCGAGGGRMWMEETIGEKINENRVNEILEKNIDQIFTACPFCMTMLEDGLKACGNENIKVKDIAELLLEASEECEKCKG